jgi:predicted PurR-regulated permease PerM
MSDATSPAVQTRRARILRSAESNHIPLRAILAAVTTVAFAYLAATLLYRLRDVLVLMLVGGFIALVLNPQVVALQRWKVPRRGVAVAIVTVWAVLVFFGLAIAFGYPLVNGLTHLANSLPAYVNKAEHGKGWIGHLVRRYHVQTWVNKNSPKLVSFAEGLEKPALALGKGVASVVISLLTTFVFVVMLLLEAPKMRVWILQSISPQRATRYTKLGSELSSSASGYMMGDLLTSVIAGIVVFITLSALSVPFAPLWGLWVALVDFLPTVGGALAGIPTVLFALTHSLTAGITTAVVFLVYTQIENHILNPMIMSRTVKVNPLLVLVTVLFGADIGTWIGGIFGGFAAALLAIPIAGAVQVIARDIWNGSRPEGPAPAIDVTPAPSEAVATTDRSTAHQTENGRA